MLILGLDFETTFTDPVVPRECRIIETGAVLWDTDRKLPVRMYSELCAWEFPTWDERVTGLTGLTQNDLSAHSKPKPAVLDDIIKMAGEAVGVMGHNALGFDKLVFEGECARHNITPPALHWIDSCIDIPYAKKIETRKLEFLGPVHGFLNPFSHRALFDVLTMLKVASFYDADEIMKRSKAQKIRLRAHTKKPWEDQGKSNDIAKGHGFRFDGDTKFWVKQVLDFEVEEACKVAGLKIEVLK